MDTKWNKKWVGCCLGFVVLTTEYSYFMNFNTHHLTPELPRLPRFCYSITHSN